MKKWNLRNIRGNLAQCFPKVNSCGSMLAGGTVDLIARNQVVYSDRSVLGARHTSYFLSNVHTTLFYFLLQVPQHFTTYNRRL